VTNEFINNDSLDIVVSERQRIGPHWGNGLIG